VGANHFVITKKFDEEVNSPLKENVKHTTIEKRPNVFHNLYIYIYIFFFYLFIFLFIFFKFLKG
jgi:hypothetical protein